MASWVNMKFNALVPELNVSDFSKSLMFYTDILGFSVAYDRPEEGFAFLVLGEAQLMIEQIVDGSTWQTAALDFPLGRGINFEIEVDSIQPILTRLRETNIPLFVPPEEKWYRVGDYESGNRQFLVQDPDGYLLRFTEDLGQRAVE